MTLFFFFTSFLLKSFLRVQWAGFTAQRATYGRSLPTAGRNASEADDSLLRLSLPREQRRLSVDANPQTRCYHSASL